MSSDLLLIVCGFHTLLHLIRLFFCFGSYDFFFVIGCQAGYVTWAKIKSKNLNLNKSNISFTLKVEGVSASLSSDPLRMMWAPLELHTY